MVRSLHLFSSESSFIPALTISCIIHLGSIFVDIMRQVSSHSPYESFSHMEIPSWWYVSTQHHLLKRLFFPHWIVPMSLSKVKDNVRVDFWALNPILWVSMSIRCFRPEHTVTLEIWSQRRSMDPG